MGRLLLPNHVFYATFVFLPSRAPSIVTRFGFFFCILWPLPPSLALITAPSADETHCEIFTASRQVQVPGKLASSSQQDMTFSGMPRGYDTPYILLCTCFKSVLFHFKCGFQVSGTKSSLSSQPSIPSRLSLR